MKPMSSSKNLNLSLTAPVNKIKFRSIARPASAAWKKKLISKKIETLKKDNSDLTVINNHRKHITENSAHLRSFIDLRKNLIDYNCDLQVKINTCLSEIQTIRRANEDLHREAMKLAKKTASMNEDIDSFKRDQEDLECEIEDLEAEITESSKERNKVEVACSEMCEVVKKKQRIVKSIGKTLKQAEALKSLEIETNRKALKKIEKVKRQIEIFMKSSSKPSKRAKIKSE